MGKKLTAEKQRDILEAGIAVFADGGFHTASMAAIARQAGISVGVLYRYYSGKEDLFRACLRHSLSALEQVLEEVTAREESLLHRARRIIQALLSFSRAHPSHIRMYHQITASAGEDAARLAGEIEGVTARLYSACIARAQVSGEVRRDVDPRLFAFFFDNLLMMLQFSYSCDYYRARLALYCGCEPDDQQMETQLLHFLVSAFTPEPAADTGGPAHQTAPGALPPAFPAG